MATKYEYFDTDLLSYDKIYNANYWKAQTFTPAIAHTITSVKFYGFNDGGDLSGLTFHVKIQAISGGDPDGSDLCSGSIAGGDVRTESHDWFEVTLGAGSLLTASVQYAIVFYLDGGDSTDAVKIYGNASGGYAGGNKIYSNNAGTDWTHISGEDYGFEEWGDAAAGLNIPIAIHHYKQAGGL